MSADDVLPPRTAHNVELRHGYTLDQVRGLSIKAAWRAIGHHLSRDQHFRRGYSNREQDRDAPATTGFLRYWLGTSQPVSGPEERATEYLALAQIWARMRPKDRELLAAMAEHEDYAKAAAALGKPRHSYATEIGRARKAFRELWHEGETPSRPWGSDHRTSKPDSPKMRATYRLRRAALARRRAKQADGQESACSPSTRPERP